jgi:uncharacterized protein
MRRALLDVNVLLALQDQAHIHHARAMQWLEANWQLGWASCPLTQNGCLRILSRPGHPNAQTPNAVRERLAEAAAHPMHRFFADDFSLLDDGVLNWNHIIGSRQLTDAYLLALAVRHELRLVTFDRSIAIPAVPGARADHLVTLQ